MMKTDDEEFYGKIKKIKTQINNQRNRMKNLSYTKDEREIIIKNSLKSLVKKALKKKNGLFGDLIDEDVSESLLRKIKSEDIEIYNLIITLRC